MKLLLGIVFLIAIAALIIGSISLDKVTKDEQKTYIIKFDDTSGNRTHKVQSTTFKANTVYKDTGLIITPSHNIITQLTGDLNEFMVAQAYNMPIDSLGIFMQNIYTPSETSQDALNMNIKFSEGNGLTNGTSCGLLHLIKDNTSNNFPSWKIGNDNYYGQVVGHLNAVNKAKNEFDITFTPNSGSTLTKNEWYVAQGFSGDGNGNTHSTFSLSN